MRAAEADLARVQGAAQRERAPAIAREHVRGQAVADELAARSAWSSSATG